MKYELINTSEPNLMREIFSYDRIPSAKFDGEPVAPSIPNDIWITDTTFRDGQQARPPYTTEQVEEIFKFMSRISGTRGLIRQTEFFLYTDADKAAVRKCQELGLKFPEITAWIRAVKKDFEIVKSMGIKETGILTSCSDYHIFLKLKKNRRQALDEYKEIVAAAIENGITPRCHLEDVTRADIYGFVIPMINELLEMSKGSGIKVKVRLCDTMGYGLPYANAALPRGVPAMLNAILKNTDIKSEQLEWHGHNDFHKVLVNAVTAWLYGCSAANGTFLGFGERTGNPPLEGLVIEWMGITGHHDGIDSTAISDAAEYFTRKIGCSIPPNYPFVGSDFNTTRAGIHADGLTKNEEIYNIFDTERWLKRPAKVAITDKSGLAGIAYWLRSNLGEAASDIRKDHPGIMAIKKWIDDEYKNGRISTISEEEMLVQSRKCLPDLFK
ncbi:MAG TPA: 2-isopropylmalate synthase [Lentisphaeria bacterium]|nr:MAG: 2-isopropylmalate synthase [Lentisphaerae bacterium GWF2_50_93]HCE45831.1 2-isopropylmalate synthase [Lentisphaeria bacterium]